MPKSTNRIKFSDRKQEKKQEEYERENIEREEVQDIIIACEDSVSSPTYFKEIVKELIRTKSITQDSFVIPIHNGKTHPTGVLETLKEYVHDNDKQYTDFKHKWIVIDRDIARVNGGGHTAQDYNNAISQAKSTDPSRNIEVAYANDCFEIWYLLHFNYFDTGITRDKVVDDLILKLKKVDATKFAHLNKKNIKDASSAKLIFKALHPYQKKAIKNSKKLLSSYNKLPDPENQNPCTTVHKLVEILNTF